MCVCVYLIIVHPWQAPPDRMWYEYMHACMCVCVCVLNHCAPMAGTT